MALSLFIQHAREGGLRSYALRQNSAAGGSLLAIEVQSGDADFRRLFVPGLPAICQRNHQIGPERRRPIVCVRGAPVGGQLGVGALHPVQDGDPAVRRADCGTWYPFLSLPRSPRMQPSRHCLGDCNILRTRPQLCLQELWPFLRPANAVFSAATAQESLRIGTSLRWSALSEVKT